MLRIPNFLKEKSGFPALAFFCILFVAATAYLTVKYFVHQPNLGKEKNSYEFVIEKGETMKGAAGKLTQIGLIDSAKTFLILHKLFFGETVLKTGVYQFSGKKSYAELFAILNRGQESLIKITIPEGYNQREIFDLLSRSALKNERRYDEAADKILLRLDSNRFGTVSSLEGFLFPETYFFSLEESEEAILETMVVTFFEKIPAGFFQGIHNQRLTPYEALILASIVEKETGNRLERNLIASVLINRIKRKMPLQSDPTVIYGLTNFDGNLRRKHLRAKTPYNTYVIPRLPPTPIANPGIESLLAVANPANTSYLYFVAKGDGSSYFSKTLGEHNRAVAKYQLRRNKNYRSTPK